MDAGHDWLPPKEALFPPSENDAHELYFLCDDLKAEMASLALFRSASVISRSVTGSVFCSVAPGEDGPKLGVTRYTEDAAR